MADDKRGRNKQAHDADRRRREREVAEELERGDESEPPIETGELADFEGALEALSFPATGREVVAAVGDREFETGNDPVRLEELVPDTDAETFDAPADVRSRVQRPTIAGATKRIVEAAVSLRNVELSESQRAAYEKTFRELQAIDAVDDDEGITVVADWIVERIHDEKKAPGSRAVRRRAAKYCRAQGYEVRNDEWLGV